MHKIHVHDIHTFILYLEENAIYLHCKDKLVSAV